VNYTPSSGTPPAVTFNNDFAALSSGTVIVNYKMIDAEADTEDLVNRGSPVTGAEYSTDGSNWYDASMGSGGDGNSGLTSSASPGISHKFSWNSATDLPNTEDPSVYFRMAPYDTLAGSWVQSSAFAVDNKAPAVNSAIHFVAEPVSGDASFQLDVSYTEADPNLNWYAYNLNGAGYAGAAGDTNTADPSAHTFSVTLDGADKFTAIKSTHTDDIGNMTLSEDTSGKFVKPLIPIAPGLSDVTWGEVKVTINANPAETGTGLYYVIMATYGVTTKYVQADGSLGGTMIWKNDWAAPVIVNGLLEETTYWFAVAAGNAQDATPSAGENSASAFGAYTSTSTSKAPPNGAMILRPNGAGSSTNLSVTGCVNNYECVYEAESDGDTTNVAASVVTGTDTYAIADHAAGISGAIYSVTVKAIARKSSSGASPAYQLVVRTHGTDYGYPTTPGTLASMSFYEVSTALPLNPSTSGAWTWAEVDALEAGMFLEHENPSKFGVYTQLWVEVSYNVPPTVTFNNDLPSLSSGTVMINYKLLDLTGDTSDLMNRPSPETGVEYSTDAVNWHDAARGTGGDGNLWLPSSASPGTAHRFSWDSAADLANTEDASVYIRMAPYDGSAYLWVTSDAFAIDNKNPVISEGVHLMAEPVSGDASFQLDVSYTEGNPGQNWYAYDLNGAGYAGAAGDAGAADPAPHTFNVSLDGADKFSAIKSTHTDAIGNVGISADDSGKYVRPLAPLAPTLDGITFNHVRLKVNDNPGENGANLYYVIKATDGVTTKYVQASRKLGNSPLWKNDWSGYIVIIGLQSDHDYWFSAAAGNAWDITPTAGENSASDFGEAAFCHTDIAPPNRMSGKGFKMQGVSVE
jgi:hypothetical protein